MAGLAFFNQTLTSARKAATLYNTYTTAKSVINQSETVGIPGNTLIVGSKFRVKAWGGLSNIVTTPGTVTFQIMMGTLASPTVAWSSGAIQLSTTAHTLIPFDLEVTLRVDSVSEVAGSTATAAKFIGGGKLNGIMFTVGAGADSTTVVGQFPVPAGAPAAGSGFDSSVANLLDFWTGFSISNAGNGVQIYDYTVEQLAGAA
jgi:hypothetical protein